MDKRVITARLNYAHLLSQGMTQHTAVLTYTDFTFRLSELKSFTLKSVRLHTGPESCMYWSAGSEANTS